MKDKLIAIIIAVIFTVVVVVLVSIIPGCHADVIRDQYNGGVCRDCGGHYHLVAVAGHLANTTYVYECDKCYKTISSTDPLQ